LHQISPKWAKEKIIAKKNLIETEASEEAIAAAVNAKKKKTETDDMEVATVG
jgi:hypothetical protein